MHISLRANIISSKSKNNHRCAEATCPSKVTVERGRVRGLSNKALVFQISVVVVVVVGGTRGNSEELRGTLWNSGAPWSPVTPCGKTIQPHGAPWKFMEPYGALWSPMEPYGALGSFTQYCGALRKPQEPYGVDVLN